LQVAVKFGPVNFRRKLSKTPPTVCVIISKIALKQVFMTFSKASPNHCFSGKNVAVRYHMFYKLWLVPT